MNRIRTAALIITALVAAAVLSACGGGSTPAPQAAAASTTQTEKAQSLDGTWTNSDPDLHVSAIIADGHIQMSFVDGNESSLYWKGTFPSQAKDGDTITSQGDVEAMQASLMGSQDDTKQFDYNNGQLSYKLTAMGVTKTMTLTKS